LSFNDGGLGQPRALFASASAKPVALFTSAAAKPFAFAAAAARRPRLKLELRSGGEGFDFIPLGIGGLLHIGLELALLAHDFLLLQLDLLLLLDDADLDSSAFTSWPVLYFCKS